MKKINLILGIIIILILFGLGCGFSYFLGKKEIGENKEICPFITLLSSKTIKGDFSTFLTGQVQGISGNSLTLINEGDSLTISIKADAPIYRLMPSEKTAEAPQPTSEEDIKIGEIKVGDRANVTCQLKADGILEGTEVAILP